MKPMSSLPRLAGRFASLLVVAMLLGACASASRQMRDEGLVLIDDGRVEEGLALLQQAAAEHPGELSYRVALIRARQLAVERVLADARDAEMAGEGERARDAYRRAQAIDPEHPRVRESLRVAANRDVLSGIDAQAREAMGRGDVDAAERLNANVLALDPSHDGARALKAEIDRVRLHQAASLPQMRSKLHQPVSLEFRDAPLKMVLDVLSRASGINFLLDKDVRSGTSVTIFVRDVPIEDAIELLLVQSQLERRLINENTILIYPNTPQKVKEFQDLVIKPFYLTNGDVKQTQQMLKTILKADDVYIDERLNLLVMRDTPEAIRLAEKLIAAQDLAEPEVVLEVEVLEVTRSKLTELGLKFPSQLVGPGGTLENAQILNGGTIGLNSGLVLNLKKEDGDTNILASPRIRVRSREQAKVHIGDRVPVVTAIVTPSTGTPVTTDQIQYLDVGLKLEVEPTVHLDDDVAIRVGLEVSTFSRLPPTPNGTTPIQVSTRNAHTMLRLHDGETQVLMGLLRDDDTRTATKVPLLGDLPGIGRLFSSELADAKKTEVVLLITPHVVRNVRRPDMSLAGIWSGTDSVLRVAQPLARGRASGAPLLADAGAAMAVPQVDASMPAAMSDAGATAAAAIATPAASAAPMAPALVKTDATAPAGGGRARGGASGKPVRYSWRGPRQVRVGEPFDLSLMSDSDAPLTATSLQMRIDPAEFEVLEITEGGALRDGDGGTAFRQRVYPAGGRIAMGVMRDDGRAVGGTGELVTLRLKARKAVGEALVHLSSVAPVGAGQQSLPVRASGPFSVEVVP